MDGLASALANCVRVCEFACQVPGSGNGKHTGDRVTIALPIDLVGTRLFFAELEPNPHFG